MESDFNNWLLVFVRAGAFLVVLPIFSTPNIPVTLRVGLAALVAFLIAPGLPAFPKPHATWLQWVALLVQELFSGLLLGFMTRMVFFATDLAGRIMANELGLNLATMFNPLSSSADQSPGMVMFFLTTVTMLSLDLHHWLLTGFQLTYSLLPIGGAHLREALCTNIVGHTGRLFLLAVQIAAPLLATSFLVMLLLSLLGRLVPQMNSFSESMAVRALAGLAVFGFTMELMAQYILNGLHRMPEDLMRVAQLLGP